MSTPEGFLKYDIKKGASFNPEYESVGYWNGSVYGWTYDDSDQPVYEKLFLFEGFNIRRAIQEEDGSYTSLSREVSMYKDKDTGMNTISIQISTKLFLYSGDVLYAWSHDNHDYEVFPVENDPVNAIIHPSVGVYGHYSQHTYFGLDVLLQYPNPLQPDEYPVFSSGDMYIGGELFIHFTKVSSNIIKYIN